jgi:catalase (peroxidase I)
MFGKKLSWVDLFVLAGLATAALVLWAVSSSPR